MMLQSTPPCGSSRDPLRGSIVPRFQTVPRLATARTRSPDVPKKASIETLRAGIDKIDRQLTVLLNRRARLAMRIGEHKARSGSKVYAPDREKRVFQKLQAAQRGTAQQQALAGDLSRGDIELPFAREAAAGGFPRPGRDVLAAGCHGAVRLRRGVGAGRIDRRDFRRGRARSCRLRRRPGRKLHRRGGGADPRPFHLLAARASRPRCCCESITACWSRDGQTPAA